MAEAPTTLSNHSKAPLWWLTFSIAALGALCYLLWLFVFRFEVSTKDAYVQGNQIIITPQIDGFIESVTIDDTNFVTTGTELVILNTIDTELALHCAEDALALATRQVIQAFEEVIVLQAQEHLKEIELIRREQDLTHRQELIASGSISLEDFEHAQAYFLEAKASLEKTQALLSKARAYISGTTIQTHPLVEEKKDQLKQAYVNYQRTTISSPVTGVVGMKRAQVGEAVTPSTPLMQIIPFDQMWVDANFKETQLRKVKIGQNVRLTADIYGRDVVFHGKVCGIGAATGAVFSLLPPQNATGNWIKIVQRLPIRIALDPEEVKQHPLRLGLSMHVHVDLRQTQGPLIPQPVSTKTMRYHTDIFNEEEKGASLLIEHILQDNGAYTFDLSRIAPW